MQTTNLRPRPNLLFLSLCLQFKIFFIKFPKEITNKIMTLSNHPPTEAATIFQQFQSQIYPKYINFHSHLIARHPNYHVKIIKGSLSEGWQQRISQFHMLSHGNFTARLLFLSDAFPTLSQDNKRKVKGK